MGERERETARERLVRKFALVAMGGWKGLIVPRLYFATTGVSISLCADGKFIAFVLLCLLCDIVASM